MSYGGGRAPGSPDARASETRILKRAEQILATTTIGAGDLDGTVFVSVPSSRLRVKMAIGFWGEGGAKLPDPLGTVQFVPLVVDVYGNETEMEPWSGATLPQALEADTAADIVLAKVHLVQQSPTAVHGCIKCVATWEPTNEMSTEEWEAVKQCCTICHSFPKGAGIVGGG